MAEPLRSPSEGAPRVRGPDRTRNPGRERFAALSGSAEPRHKAHEDSSDGLPTAGGEVTATEPAEELSVSRQAVVKRLAVLDAAARWMSALAADRDRRLARVERVAEAAERASRG
ncbi:transcriptional regulator [Streptomyces populi]